MSANVDHPAFTQPSDATQRIWRYMDFAKLVALLEGKSLHFARIDQLGDPFEGSLSKSEYEEWRDLAAQGEGDGSLPPHGAGKYFDVLLANTRRARRSMYVNCWHWGPGESEAMWRVYAPSGYGIAIQSTYAHLVQALPSQIHNGCFVGLVQYTDHHREKMPVGNVLYPVLHKGRAFEHEREVRAVIWIGDRGMDVDPDQRDNPVGLSVPVLVTDLIETLHISPTAPGWFVDAVRGVVKRYGATFQVSQSELAGPGYY